MPFDFMPLWIVMEGDSLYNAWHQYLAEDYYDGDAKLIQYNLKSCQQSVVNDPELPPRVDCVIRNDSCFFAGGRKGLAAYNIAEKKWQRWHELDAVKINYMHVHKDILWLGTEDGVLGINWRMRKLIRKINTEDGLKSPRILSVYANDDCLFISTYHGEGDIVGEGVDCLDLISGKLSHLSVPKIDSLPYGYKEFSYGAIDIYRIPGEKTLRMALWERRFATLFDYSPAQNTFEPIYESGKKCTVSKTFDVLAIDPASSVGKSILKFISENYFHMHVPNSVASDAADLIYQSKDYNRIQELMNHEKSAVRCQAIWQFGSHDDPRLNGQLIQAIHDPEETVANTALGVINRRQYEAALPAIMKLIENGNGENSRDSRRSMAVLYLADFPSEKIREFIEGQLKAEKSRSVAESLRKALDQVDYRMKRDRH